MKLSGPVPLLVRAQALCVQLIRDALDGDLHLGNFGVIEGLGVALEGSRRVLTEQQDSLHGTRGNIEIDVPQGIALVANDLAVPQYAVVKDRQAAGVLVADHPGELCVGDHVGLEANVLDGVAGVVSGLYSTAVVVESKLVFEAVPQGRLVEGHVRLEQLEIEGGKESVAIRSCNGLVGGNVRTVSCADTEFGRVSVGSCVNTLVLRVLPLASCLPEVLIAVENVAIIYRHDLVAGDPDRCLLHGGAADVLDQCSVGVGRGQRDCESQPRGSRDYDIIGPQVRKPHEQLLILVNRRGIVCHDNRLPHSLYPQGVPKAAVWVKPTSVRA